MVLQAKDSQFDEEIKSEDEEIKSEKSVDKNLEVKSMDVDGFEFVPQFTCSLCDKEFMNLGEIEKHTSSFHQILDKNTLYSLVLQAEYCEEHILKLDLPGDF